VSANRGSAFIQATTSRWRALREAMTLMVLAGIPDGFRLALVAALPRPAQTYRNTLFENEADAARWLDGNVPALR
jgi:hypothetical protein